MEPKVQQSASFVQNNARSRSESRPQFRQVGTGKLRESARFHPSYDMIRGATAGLQKPVRELMADRKRRPSPLHPSAGTSGVRAATVKGWVRDAVVTLGSPRFLRAGGICLRAGRGMLVEIMEPALKTTDDSGGDECR